jgi:fluoride exporter
MAINVLVIFLGAGVGGVLRYAAGLAIARGGYVGAFPLATFLVNVVGCLAIGYLMVALALLWPGREVVRLALMVGVLGGFTTFSSFGRETFELIDQGRPTLAIAYVLLSNAVGIATVFAGYAIGRAIHVAH